MAAHNDLGKWGEEVATAYLRDKGYIIVERDWHSQHRDLDIIALDDGVMVFIEVKTRMNAEPIEPGQRIGKLALMEETPQRQRRMLQVTIQIEHPHAVVAPRAGADIAAMSKYTPEKLVAVSRYQSYFP